ncbi:MAG: heme exporter protein CcmD [Desulfovibrio sp.]|nr:heme exporter protein CcmD [Desulfovibrio sp.]
MQWGSLSEFLALGGHGFWVWMAWGTAIAVIVFELVSLAAGRRAALAVAARLARLSRDAQPDEEEQ